MTAINKKTNNKIKKKLIIIQAAPQNKNLMISFTQLGRDLCNLRQVVVMGNNSFLLKLLDILRDRTAWAAQKLAPGFVVIRTNKVEIIIIFSCVVGTPCSINPVDRIGHNNHQINK